MPNLRYINLREIDPTVNSCMYDSSFMMVMADSIDTICIAWRVSEPTFGMTNILPLADQVQDVDRVFQLARVSRLDVPIRVASNGLIDPKTTNFYFAIPDMGIVEARRMVMASVIRGLKQCGVECFNRPNSNDLYLTVGNKEKKFSGFLNRDIGDGIARVMAFITFDFDVVRAREIYDLTHPKFTKKDDVKDIADIVGSLHEVMPDLDQDSTIDSLVQTIAERMEGELVSRALTASEWKVLTDLVPLYDNEEWILNAQRTSQ